MTIEDLKSDDYHSSARNKLIVEAFFLTGNIEKYGTRFIASELPYKTIPECSLITRRCKTVFMSKLSAALAEITGLSIHGVEKNIVISKKDGLIQRVGSSRKGYWELMTKNKE